MKPLVFRTVFKTLPAGTSEQLAVTYCPHGFMYSARLPLPYRFLDPLDFSRKTKKPTASRCLFVRYCMSQQYGHESYFALLLSASSVLMLATPAAQLLLRHAVLSSVTLTFSSKDALVHFLMLSILGHSLLLFPGILTGMHVFTRFTHCFCMHAPRICESFRSPWRRALHHNDRPSRLRQGPQITT